MKYHIPKSKGDVQAVKHLQALAFDSIRADVPELLIWLQDINWPIAKALFPYLLHHVNDMKKECSTF